MHLINLQQPQDEASEDEKQLESGDRSASLPPLAPKRPPAEPEVASGGAPLKPAMGMKHSRSLNSDKFDALLMAATGVRKPRFV